MQTTTIVPQPVLRPFDWILQTGTALVSLTKPLVTALLVFTAVCTAWAASGPWVSARLLLTVAFCGGLVSSGGAAVNQYLECDLDARMTRTARRAIPSGRISPLVALVWGLGLTVAGVLLSNALLPEQATFFIVLGWLIYVPLYTLVLKRHTSMNVVIGGVAGCCPVLAGWAAARADWPVIPFALAMTVFFWTPAHFWAYSLVHRESYRSAGFPMLSVEQDYAGTAQHILAHAGMMVLASAFAFQGLALWVALALGLLFVGMSVFLWRRPSSRIAYRLYKVSNYYLVAVFLALVLGAALGV